MTGIEFQALSSVLVQGTLATPLPTEFTSKSVLLDAIPPSTEWLVIKGVYYTRMDAGSLGMECLLIHVECLGKNGACLDEDTYKYCLVQMNGANIWFGRKRLHATQTFSRLIIHEQFAENSRLMKGWQQAHVAASSKGSIGGGDNHVIATESK
jgi:hypothetical protein